MAHYCSNVLRNNHSGFHVNITFSFPVLKKVQLFFLPNSTTRSDNGNTFEISKTTLKVHFQNILCNLNSLFSVRFQNHLMFLPVLEFLENSIPGFLSISSRGKFLFFHLQFFTALSMNIHRISSVTHPVGHGEVCQSPTM